jgi:hypothetical protein
MSVEVNHIEVKDNHVNVEKKDIGQQIKNEVIPTRLEAQKRAKGAREKAHTVGADVKRGISMEIKNKLSECFDFIEESCGSGAPTFEFYDNTQEVSECIIDGIEQPVKYPIIGRATGVFAPIGVMSRNNRIYDGDHYDYILGNQHLVDRIGARGMLGTIGHHDKKVDDQDLADGKVSHIVTDLHIKEEEDGTRNLYGTLEILDTPAGRLLKTYYDSGMPLFVSSRGGGNLLNVPNESYKRVDKTKYFLETFDIVRNPGFLQAKPVYEKVSEDVAEEPVEETQEVHESVDKLDVLLDKMSDLITIISESKKEEKEDNEKKEAVEKKETKEKAEAKEAKEKAIVEEKKEDKEEKKEDKKPEDEKNDEEESAVADSVLEESADKTEKDKENKDTDIKKELQKRVALVQCAGETSGQAQEVENEQKEPITLCALDLARALKERAKRREV